MACCAVSSCAMVRAADGTAGGPDRPASSSLQAYPAPDSCDAYVHAMSSRVIRYTTKPECAQGHAELIGAVCAELAQTRPEGFRYEAFRLEDGVSFVHVATLDGDDNPLAGSTAFAAFQAGLPDRVAEPPVAKGAELVGSYLPGPWGSGPGAGATVRHGSDSRVGDDGVRRSAAQRVGLRRLRQGERA